MTRPNTAICGFVLLCVASSPLGCGRDPSSARPPLQRIRTLNVLTPHSEDIRSAFGAGFATWFFASQGEQVHVNYIYRGTPQCVEYARDAQSLRASGAPGTIPDVMFGGGINDHTVLARDRISRPIEMRDERRGPVPTIQGLPLRDAENYWFATGLSTFGILYNAAACQARGVAPPTTWADLADPRFAGWVAVADPSASGSHRECLVLMIKHLGWERGWSTVLQILANARALESRSGDALRQVRTGTALATFAVNFDGQSLAAGSDGELVYFDPPGATAATPDVISVLRSAQDVSLAEQFVQYVLSEQGQSLWGVKPEARTTAGPALYHYPISPEIYESFRGHLAVERNPLTEDFGVKFDLGEGARLARILSIAVEALCSGEGHVQLQLLARDIAARRAAAALAELVQPPFTLEAAGEQADRLKDTEEPARADIVKSWREAFEGRLAAARAKLGS